jgi:mannose-1-phosphate guanylyltransferase
MKANENDKHRWGVILAGGDGNRLRPLTHLVSEDDRPKQFCPLLDGQTLLAQTQLRIAGTVNPDQTLFVLNKAHEPFYRKELANVPAIQKVVQPGNRGTLPAILWSLLRIVRFDDHAVVAFFPSDHYYSQEGQFIAGIISGYEQAERHTQSIILLGAVANRAETQYGWIEPETSLVSDFHDRPTRVRRFWEKPSSVIAQSLFNQGCLWNTFVMVGRASAFLNMIEQTAPVIYRDFKPILTLHDLETESEVAQSLYNRLPAADFSTSVLSANTEDLCVASLGDIGWSDLGDPRRLITTLYESGMKNPWVSEGSCNQCGVSLALS